MLNFADIHLFIRISKSGGITRAAKLLGITPAAASAALKRLERQLNTQLFERSTRWLRLTQAGEDFLTYCEQSLQILDEGIAVLQQRRIDLSGEIHLGAPSDLGRDRLDEILEPFRRQHPRISLIMHLSDAVQDFYQNPLDVALRYGVLRDSNLIAKKLSDNDRVICAAPGYIERHGQPDSIEALRQHNCICYYRNGELFNRWRVVFQEKTTEVTVYGDRAADDGALVRKWALQGHGIAYKFRFDIDNDLNEGRLIDLFPGASCEKIPLYVIYPSKQYQSARLTALLVFLQNTFAAFKELSDKNSAGLPPNQSL
ncbi:MAG: LysR family transcriptional regulator [Methylomonas sp.]|jgi:DNA-binding transcriptional LysR family regulator|uniref:LysR family transcriptional regulator n=1 Tax=Methylomonas sp. TaxID=418 RepID=UPI0025FFF4BA|nr:LysR family transcriptional regulator [Methylomonas sp.]MCK9605595.1 LysR family transcriptional regulator [Methylomonas sp.]